MSYNAWLYGYANPVVNKDPSGYQTENAQPCSDGLRYCQLEKFNNAVIDVHHFYDSRNLAKRITTEIDSGLGRDVNYFALGNTLSKVFPYYKYYRTSLPTTIIKGGELYNGIALGIFMNFQYGLEDFESLSSLFPILCSNGHCSGFSNEDLPTDYLGFVAEVVKGGWSITDVSNKFGGGVGLEEFPEELSGSIEDAIRCSIFNDCGEDNPYNKCWEFKVPNSEGKFQYVPWPSDMVVKPEKEGSYWNEYVVPITITY